MKMRIALSVLIVLAMLIGGFLYLLSQVSIYTY